MRILRRAFLSLTTVLLLAISHPAKAQLSVYATPMFTGYGYTDGSENSTIQFGSNSGGIGAGVFYNFHHNSRLFLGMDARGSGSFGTHGGEAFSTSFRIGMVPYKVPLRPYFQAGIGAVTGLYPRYGLVCGGYYTCTEYALPSQRITNPAILVAWGLAVRVTRSVDIRALEYGVQVPDYPNSSGNYVGFGFLDAGLVYNFHAKNR